MRGVWRETLTPALTAWAVLGFVLLIDVIVSVASQFVGFVEISGTTTALVIGYALSMITLTVQTGLQLLFLMMAARQSQHGWKT